MKKLIFLRDGVGYRLYMEQMDIFHIHNLDIDIGIFGYKIDKTKAKDIEIVEREDTEPVGHIVKYEEKFVSPNIWFSLSGKVLFPKRKTVIYVPKYTVKIVYNVSV